MDLAVSAKVVARDEFGRFVDAIKVGGAESMAQLAKEGAEISRELAPYGSKPDPRGGHIKDNISFNSTSTTAQWYVHVRQGLPQETGAVPHRIPGNVTFFWEREGYWWKPGDNEIKHPGNAPKPYLRPAYEIIMARSLMIVKEHMPQ